MAIEVWALSIFSKFNKAKQRGGGGLGANGICKQPVRSVVHEFRNNSHRRNEPRRRARNVHALHLQINIQRKTPNLQYNCTTGHFYTFIFFESKLNFLIVFRLFDSLVRRFPRNPPPS